jgi:hypothetical protein
MKVTDVSEEYIASLFTVEEYAKKKHSTEQTDLIVMELLSQTRNKLGNTHTAQQFWCIRSFLYLS